MQENNFYRITLCINYVAKTLKLNNSNFQFWEGIVLFSFVTLYEYQQLFSDRSL